MMAGWTKAGVDCDRNQGLDFWDRLDRIEAKEKRRRVNAKHSLLSFLAHYNPAIDRVDPGVNEQQMLYEEVATILSHGPATVRAIMDQLSIEVSQRRVYNILHRGNGTLWVNEPIPGGHGGVKRWFLVREEGDDE